jgi:hypothetical protein
MLNNFLTIDLRAKNIIDRLNEIIPKEFKNVLGFVFQIT